MTPTNETADGTVRIDGRTLSLADVARVARKPGTRVELTDEAREKIAASRSFIEEKVASGERVYGVTTGFGRLADVAIAEEERTALQHNLVRSHASGMGDPLDVAVVRSLMLLRANALARGVSGCRVDVVQRILDFLNHGIHPRVPEFGSVGASGDLAPLAHVGLALLGEGEAEHDGAWGPVARWMEAEGLEPLTLKSKEGLALINGTQATTGMGILALTLAALGVGGVVTDLVNQRRKDIGIQIALGASRRRVLSTLGGEMSIPILGGVLVGSVASLALGRVAEAFLFGVAPADPTSLVIGVSVLSGVALSAILVPASRASRLDPMQALRAE